MSSSWTPPPPLTQKSSSSSSMLHLMPPALNSVNSGNYSPQAADPAASPTRSFPPLGAPPSRGFPPPASALRGPRTALLPPVSRTGLACADGGTSGGWPGKLRAEAVHGRVVGAGGHLWRRVRAEPQPRPAAGEPHLRHPRAPLPPPDPVVPRRLSRRLPPA